MNFPIKRFSIEKLLGNLNYAIEIENSATIIVGPNGSGKSNFLNIFYYFISKQFHKISDFQFKKIIITTSNGGEKTFHQDEIVNYISLFLETARTKEIYEFLTKNNKLSEFFTSDISTEDLNYYSEKTGVPSVVLNNIRKRISFQLKETPAPLDLDHFIDSLNIGPIIYMPTYRRIEKSMEHLLPRGYRKSYDEDNEDVQFNSLNFIEVVNFGMSDVKKIIEKELKSSTIKKQKEIEKASQEYILDIVRGKVKSYSTQKIKKINEHEFKDFILTLDTSLFSQKDKDTLESKMVALITKKGAGKPTTEEQYLSLYVEKLLNSHEKIKIHDRALKSLTDIANKYIGANKSFDFLKHVAFVNNFDHSLLIDLDGLSSGEKQILALFTYLIISNNKNYCLIIDEPELSLSVPWQKTLLPDVISTGNCSHVFAVTHSPFIFDNHLINCIVDTQTMEENFK